MTFEEGAAVRLDGGLAVAGGPLRAIERRCESRGFLNVGREADTSFVLHLDHDLIAILRETHPDTFWKTPHYEGYPAVLVRYHGPDDDLVREMIGRAHAQALARPSPRPRKARGA